MKFSSVAPNEGVPLGLEIVDGAFQRCSELIEYLNTLEWFRSPIGTPDYTTTADIRTSTSIFRPLLSFKNPEVVHDFARCVWEFFVTYSIAYGFSIDEVENISFNRYEPGQRFNPHTDYYAGSNRVVSAVAYLNSIETGGETHFTHYDFSVKAVEGRLALFPSNFLFHHSGEPPMSTTKYSAAIWARA